VREIILQTWVVSAVSHLLLENRFSNGKYDFCCDFHKKKEIYITIRATNQAPELHEIKS